MRDLLDRVGVVDVVDVAEGIAVVLVVIDWPQVAHAYSQGPSVAPALAAGPACLVASELEAFPSCPSVQVQTEARFAERSSVWLGEVDVDEVGSAYQAGNYRSEVREQHEGRKRFLFQAFQGVQFDSLRWERDVADLIAEQQLAVLAQPKLHCQ